MRPTLVGTLVVFALLVCIPASAREAAPDVPQRDAHFDFLYLNANEDQASGGHAAVRLGEDVFHFQYDEGLLRMERDPWADFQLVYRGLQNRTIHRSEIAVSRDTHERLRAAFVGRELAQSHQIERLRAARRDVELVAALGRGQREGLSLPGVGFFESPRAQGEAAASRLVGLRAAVTDRHGRTFLESELQAARDRLAGLEVRPLAAREQDFEPGALPRLAYPFHARYEDAVADVQALEVLQHAPALRSRIVLPDHGAGDFSLGPDEVAVLELAARGLEERLVVLLGSKRPARGRALLLGMARLEAMELSLRQGRWQFVDALADRAVRIEIGPNTRAALPRLAATAQLRWREARKAWRLAGVWNESAMTRLERAAAGAQELAGAVAGASTLRLHRGEGLPEGRGQLPGRWPLPTGLAHNPASALERVSASRREIEPIAKAALGYRLLTRNCVSELFATVEMAMVDALEERGHEATTGAIAAELSARLGGVVEPSPIPFVASDQVRSHWRVVREQELPSMRRERAAQLIAAHPSPWIRLRESNTWTSTLYDPGDRDSYFLFFTDDEIAPRPLEGLVNLVAAFGRAGVGIATLPFDRGRGLGAGVRGVLFSLPELAFFNIRKGTSVWLPLQLEPVNAGLAGLD